MTGISGQFLLKPKANVRVSDRQRRENTGGNLHKTWLQAVEKDQHNVGLKPYPVFRYENP